MKKLYGPSVQSWFSQALDFITRRQEQRQSHRRRDYDDDEDEDDDYKPKTPQDRQMEQLDQLKEIYGIEDPFKQTHHNKPVHHKQETDQNQDSETDSDMKPMTPSEKTQMFSNALNKIYGVKPDQKPYKPVDQETFQKQQSAFKHNAYKKTLEKIYGKKIDQDDKTGKYDVVDWDSDYKPRSHRRNQTDTVESDDEE
ncbi:UNKNOWN [Stylonychia lemnae]|uniref:Uncharacterized protein n=1 Tax=Stylonychia lemnae TaxID=5949 RepID=A0A077ZXB6_STYLE|nr:UNKNOWN [Stylonychia lemnae]|eukprot:CDW73186.1 UNKNOWN [Stylonychia lemnae]